MKKRKIGLWLNIVTIAMCLCAIAVGVYSAKQTKLSISGTLGFTAYSNANVVCKIVGAKNTSGTISTTSSPFYLTPSGLQGNTSSEQERAIKMTKDMKALDFSVLSFAYDDTTKEPIDMVFTFTITNTSNEVIVADLNIDNLICNCVSPSWGTDGALQIIKPESLSVTGADVKNGKADIELTLHLTKSMNIDKAISGSMMLNIEPPQATPTGFVVNESGYLTTVPSTSDTNASITIPAYYYDGTSTYRKVKMLYSNSGFEPLVNISSYTTVKISNGVPAFGGGAFNGCTNLKNIIVPSSVTNYGASAFSGCTGLTSVPFSKGLKSMGTYLFEGCTGITDIYFPNYLILSGSATGAGESFKGMPNLKTFVFAEDSCVEKISMSTFQNCPSLTTVTLPDSLTTIDNGAAFSGCSSLASITLPSKLTYIGVNTFSNCTSLTAITYKGTMAQWNAIQKGNNWNAGTGEYSIHCTDGDIAKS